MSEKDTESGDFFGLAPEISDLLPTEIKIDIVEAHIIRRSEEADESIPASLLRLMGFRRLNRIYTRLDERVDEANELIERAIEHGDDLGDEDIEGLERIVARTVFYEDALLFIFLAQDLIETLSIQFLEEELIQEEYHGSNSTWEMFDRHTNGKGREELLLRTGLIDGRVKGKMRSVRDTRNKIAHRTEVRQRFEFGPEVMELVSDAMFVLNELRLRIDGEPFWEERN